MKHTVVSVDRNWVGNMDRDYYIRPNFQVKEFACGDGTNVILVSTQTLDWLQEIRNRVNKIKPNTPIRVNSAHRTYYYNAKIGGSKNSQHVFGRAVDVKIPCGFSVEKFHRIVCDVVGNTGGIGKYDTFIHIDSRKGKARW